MKHVKVDATTSTNELAKSINKKDFNQIFCVSTEFQTKGKGQHENVWTSEKSKNLMFTVVLNGLSLKIEENFNLNILVCCGLISVLKKYNLPELKLKWPNDILSVQKKICGILIENTLSGKYITTSYIGIGLNVNQLVFENLPKASSLGRILHQQIDKEELLNQILEEFMSIATKLKNHHIPIQEYKSLLYGYDYTTEFQMDKHKKSGIITGINPLGELEIQFEDSSKGIFNHAQIRQIY